MNRLLPLIWAVGLSALLSLPTLAQTYPSPTFNNTTTNGNASIAGTLTLQGHVINPTPPSSTTLCTPIENFGGAGDNATDNSTPLRNTIASFGTSGGCVGFGAGRYVFGSQVAVAPSSSANPYHIGLRGTGPGSTVLYWAAGGGVSFTQANFNQTIDAEDFSCITGTSGTGNCLTLTSLVCLSGSFISQNYFRNIEFRGDDFSTKYWSAGISDIGMSSTNYESDEFFGGGPSLNLGIGISIAGNPSACGTTAGYAIWHNVAKSQFYALGDGILMGQYTQGLTVEQGNFQNGSIGILSPSGLAGSLAQFSVHNSSFNTGNTAIEIDSPVSGSMYVGNTIDVATGHVGISLSSTGANNSYNTIIGNAFQGASLTGTVGVSTVGAQTIISGNTFSALQVGANGGTNTSVLIYGNLFNGNTTAVQGGLIGQSCTSTPSGSFTSLNGVVTHC